MGQCSAATSKYFHCTVHMCYSVNNSPRMHVSEEVSLICSEKFVRDSIAGPSMGHLRSFVVLNAQ